MDFEDHRDLFDQLPAKSRVKIRSLCDASERAYEAMLAAWRRVNDERTDLARVKVIVAQQEAAAVGRRAGFSLNYEELALRNPPLPDQSPSRHALTDDEVERLDDRVRAAQERVDHAVAAQEAASVEFTKFEFLTEVVDWLKVYLGRGGRLAHQPLPAVKLARGESFHDAMKRVRAQISACDDEWSRVDLAPMPAAEIKTAIVDQVDRLAAACQPRILGRDAPDGPTNLADILKIRAIEGRPVADCAGPLLAWLHRDEIIARLHAQVDALDLAGAMTDDQRDRAFSVLLDKKLELNFAEEALIAAAEREGTIMPRRRDADPRAVLEVGEVFSDIESREGAHDEDRPARRRAPVHQESAL